MLGTVPKRTHSPVRLRDTEHSVISGLMCQVPGTQMRKQLRSWPFGQMFTKETAIFQQSIKDEYESRSREGMSQERKRCVQEVRKPTHWAHILRKKEKREKT